MSSDYLHNGKRQSCEPCRKSKLRCDHRMPVCGRCISKRCVDRCIYQRGTRGESTEARASDHVPNVVAISEYSCELSHLRPNTIAPTPRDPSSVEVPFHNLGFLGVTSYSAILSDALNVPDSIDSNRFGCSGTAFDPSSNDIERGSHVLSIMKNRCFIDFAVGHWYKASDGSCICPEFVMKQWLEHFWRHYEAILVDDNAQNTRNLSGKIWRNTQSQATFNKHTTALEWALARAGQYIRWQVIGLIAVVLGFSVGCMDPNDHFLIEHKVSQSVFVKVMVEVSEACISFVRRCGQLDDAFAWHLYEHTRLIRVTRGEGSHEAYRATGEVNDAVISMGLHQDVTAGNTAPFFLSELRRRLLAWVYTDEISLATFLGRPPRLSFRYCNLEAPLGLTDQQIQLEGCDLAAVIANLDRDNPYSTEFPQRMTWLRVRFGFGPIREKILDLNLGFYTSEEVQQRAVTIEKENKEQWSKLPPFMHEILEISPSISKLEGLELLYRTMFRQEFHSNDLLVQRVLVRKAFTSSQKLIRVAQVIFNDILLITQSRDFAFKFRVDLVSLLIIHGLRNAAILAVELLKQEQRGSTLDNHLLQRSRTIQELSVFADRLGAVEPSSGGYGMCQQGRRIITHILDSILSQKDSPVQPSAQPQAGAETVVNQCLPFVPPNMSSLLEETQQVQTFGFENFISSEPDYNFIQWLANVDWNESSI